MSTQLRLDDISDAEVGKPYRGTTVVHIGFEFTRINEKKCREKRFVTLEDGFIIIEDTLRDLGDVYAEYTELPMLELHFPYADENINLGSRDNVKGKDPDKQSELRKKAREMLSNKKGLSPPSDKDLSSKKPIKKPVTKPNKALIYPEEKARGVSGTPKIAAGVWELPSNSKTETKPNEVKEVRLYHTPLSNSSKPLWKYALNAVPNEEGIFDPKDMLFYPKGESIDEPDGYWSADDTLPLKPKKASLKPNKATDPIPAKKPNQQVPNTESDGSSKRNCKKIYANSVRVYPDEKSAPSKGEKGNLQGVWSTPPGKESKDPIEVKIHRGGKEPVSDGKIVHGLYGYLNGAKPDTDGVVDPKDLVFYPPGEKPKEGDNFERVGYWSSPNSKSETRISWRFEGVEMIYDKKVKVTFNGFTTIFTSQFKK